MADIRQAPAVLDDMQRPDEYPLSHGGDWSPNASDTLNFSPMKLKGFKATHPKWSSGDTPITGPERFASSWWTESFSTSITGMVEVWAVPSGGNASGVAWSLGLFQNPGGPNTLDGYFWRQEVTTGGGGTHIYKYTNGTRVVLSAGSSAGTAGFPSRIWLFRIFSSGLMQAYSSNDFGANWTLRTTANDLTYQGTFYLAIGVTDNSFSQLPGWSSFGGGVDVERRTRIIRWVSN